MEVDIDELCDRTEWIASLLRQQPVAEIDERIAERARQHVTASALLQQRLGLTETELRVLWLLVAAAMDDRIKQTLMTQSGMDPTFAIATLRRAVYGSRPSVVANRELGPSGTLRRLGLIERSDGGGMEVHESRQSWAVAGRILTWLHGDPSLDPTLAGLVRLPDDARPLE